MAEKKKGRVLPERPVVSGSAAGGDHFAAAAFSLRMAFSSFSS